jgi:hypothetical protein
MLSAKRRKIDSQDSNQNHPVEKDEIFLSVSMLMPAPTGRRIGLSTTWLTLVAAAILTQNHPAPQIAGQFTPFLLPGHGLVHISEKIRYGWAGHC